MSPVIVKGIPVLTVHRERQIGTRVGPLALDWDGDTKPLLSERGWMFDGRLNEQVHRPRPPGAGGSCLTPATMRDRIPPSGWREPGSQECGPTSDDRTEL